MKPSNIDIELRLYQNNEILYHTPTAEDIVPIMDKIITFDKVIRKFKNRRVKSMSLTDDILMHYGMPRRSGRYPWGSGDNPYQHSGDFLSRVEEMKKSGFTFTDKDGKTYTGEVAIAKSMGLSTTQFRTQMSLAKDERRSADVSAAKALREKGYSLNEIAEKMGFANDSSVRSLLNESSEARMNQAKTTAEFLKKQVDEKA